MHFAVPSTLTTNQVQTNFEQKPIQNEFIGNFDLILDGEFGDLFLIGLLDEAGEDCLDLRLLTVLLGGGDFLVPMLDGSQYTSQSQVSTTGISGLNSLF
jgi:hypothetical protein